MEKETERSRARKSSRGAATGRSPSPTASEGSSESPKTDRVRILAYEIYETRNSSGMLGDAVSDWLEAERRLTEPDTGTVGDERAETRSNRTRGPGRRGRAQR